MFSPIPSDISQNNAEILEEQWWEMQKRHKEEQQLLAFLEKTAEVCCGKHVAQKIRKIVEAKAREKAKKRRLAKKEDKRKQIEYLQQLQDKILVKNTTLLEDTERS